MSVCDSCRLPGRCCTGFGLGIPAASALDLLVELATVHHGTVAGASVILSRGGGNRTLRGDEQHVQVGLPFMPLWELPQQRGVWRLWCPWLGPDGRCTNYDERPSVCRAFEPMSDKLCIEYFVDPAAALPAPGIKDTGNAD